MRRFEAPPSLRGRGLGWGIYRTITPSTGLTEVRRVRFPSDTQPIEQIPYAALCHSNTRIACPIIQVDRVVIRTDSEPTRKYDVIHVTIPLIGFLWTEDPGIAPQ